LAWGDGAVENHLAYCVWQMIEPLQQTACMIETLCFFGIVGSRHVSQQYNRM